MSPRAHSDQPCAIEVDDTRPELPQSEEGETKKTAIQLADGTLLRVDELPVPESIRRLLVDLDFDNRGTITEEETFHACKLVSGMKSALDTSKDGSVTQEELMEGVDLLARMKQMKENNAAEMEYLHLPPIIQDVMKEWDSDCTGKISADELIAAAKAFKLVQQEGRMMKKIILGMALVILMLLGGMFALTFIAIDISKEMRGSSDGVMQTPSGDVVKVGSSDYAVAADGSMVLRSSDTAATCPEGKSCRRLGSAGAANALKVAQAETKRKLSSTLPDDAFKELKSLTLGDSKNHSLKFIINGFKRLQLRTSKCGSVVQLDCVNGVLTIDDYEIHADEKMQAYIEEAGMAELFDAPAAFGRRLSATDGMLEGFFNLLNDVEWECESTPLPSPEDIPQSFLARIHVKHQHSNPRRAESKLFADEDGVPLDLPGIVEENGRVFKTWTEELLQVGSVQAYLTSFEMNPYMQELRIKMDGVQLRMDVMRGTGYRCVAEDAQKTLVSNAQGAGARMTFVGAAVERGLVLRQYRLFLHESLDADVRARRLQEDQAETARAMAQAGLVPNIIDYYDVDTDPSGRRQPGEPFRIRMFSSVPGSKVFTEKLYESLKTVDPAMDLSTVLATMNATGVYEPCAAGRNATDFVKRSDLLARAAELPVLKDLKPANFTPPPPLEPWSESPQDVKRVLDRLRKARKRDTAAPELARAEASNYWSSVMRNRKNRDQLARALEILPSPFADEYVNYTYDWSNASNDSQGDQHTVGEGVHLPRRLGTFYRSQREGEYKVVITEDDLERTRKPSRRLSRRLGDDDDEPQFVFEATINPEKITVGLNVGKAEMSLIVHYCHLYVPYIGWDACATGRLDKGSIVKVEGYAKGKQIVWPFPTVDLKMGGGLVYDDTTGLECAAVKVFLFSESARGRNIQDSDGALKLSVNRGGWEKFILEDAGGGKYWIKSHRNKWLQDNNGAVRLSNVARGWEKWRITGGVGGKMHIISHRGKYLAVRGGGSQTSSRCTVTLFRNKECRGGSREFSTVSTTGEEFKFSDDNWRSARIQGQCRSVEFYDEDEEEKGYEDNQIIFGARSCHNSFPSDLDEDMAGLFVVAEAGQEPTDWTGSLALTSTKNYDSTWKIRKEFADDRGDDACRGGDMKLYGLLTFEKEVDLILDEKLSFTTELGASHSTHPVFGSYISEVYGKGIIEAGPVQGYLNAAMNPNEPWYNEYKLWKFCLTLGYEIDAWITTYRDSLEIFCADLNFR